MAIRVQIIGQNEVIGKLSRLNVVAAAKVRAATNEAALNIATGAKRRAPVDTGRLRSSIRPTFFDGGIAAEIGTDVFYAPFQEFGTSHGVPPHPFLFPSWEEERPRYLARVAAALKSLEGGF